MQLLDLPPYTQRIVFCLRQNLITDPNPSIYLAPKAFSKHFNRIWLWPIRCTCLIALNFSVFCKTKLLLLRASTSIMTSIIILQPLPTVLVTVQTSQSKVWSENPRQLSNHKLRQTEGKKVIIIRDNDIDSHYRTNSKPAR